MLCHPYSLQNPLPRGTKAQLDASPLPSWGTKRGRKCYVNPAFSCIPNARRGEQNQKWSPTKGNKIRSGYLTPAFSEARKRAEMRHQPCILKDPQRQAQGAKSEMVRSKRKQHHKWSPTKGNKIRSGYLTLAFSAPRLHCFTLAGCTQNVRGGIFFTSSGSNGGRWMVVVFLRLFFLLQKRVFFPIRFFRGPKKGRHTLSTLHSPRAPTEGNQIRLGYLTPSFSRAQKRLKMLYHPCNLNPNAKRGEQKSEVVPNKGEQNQKWLPHPCLLRGPKEGGNATSPMGSWGS